MASRRKLFVNHTSLGFASAQAERGKLLLRNAPVESLKLLVAICRSASSSFCYGSDIKYTLGFIILFLSSWNPLHLLPYVERPLSYLMIK